MKALAPSDFEGHYAAQMRELRIKEKGKNWKPELPEISPSINLTKKDKESWEGTTGLYMRFLKAASEAGAINIDMPLDPEDRANRIRWSGQQRLTTTKTTPKRESGGVMYHTHVLTKRGHDWVDRRMDFWGLPNDGKEK